MGSPRWPWWHQLGGNPTYRVRELLRAVWDLHGLYGQSEWLWRGQADSTHNLTAAVHTRIEAGGLNDDRVKECTIDLIRAARRARLDEHEGTRLPDLALLAMLQHHGAATPLLDVSHDPLVGLYMAVVSPSPADDDKNGVLFAIRRPEETLRAYESDRFRKTYCDLPDETPKFYTAPDISERLRIQRGNFLIAKVSDNPRTSLPIKIDPVDKGTPLKHTPIYKFMEARRGRGRPTSPPQVAVFRVASDSKPQLKEWLETRSGLTREYMLPTAWHQPHLDAFCSAHGRSVKWP